MKLENFVNAMGINVIQIIKQIQSDDERGKRDNKNVNENKKKNNVNSSSSRESIIIDTNTLIDSNWYVKRLKNRHHHKCDETTSSTVVSRKNHGYTLAEARNLLLSSTKEKRGISGPIRSSALVSTEKINEDEGKDSNHYNFPKYEVICSSPSVKIPIQSSRDYHPLFSPLNFTIPSSNRKSSKNDVEIKKTKDILKQRVWKKPKIMRWCSAEEFLSKKIKTYQDACDLVTRSSDVVVRTLGRNKLDGNEYITDKIEYISLDECYNKTIDFVKPLYT